MPQVTAAQLRSLLSPSLSIAGMIAACTPNKLDDSFVLGFKQVAENDAALDLLAAFINRLIDAFDGDEIPPEQVAALQQAVKGLA